MPNATGPWCHPPALPENARTLCLVLIEDRKGIRSYHIMRYLRNNWQFQEGLGMGNHRVVAWAVIMPQEEMSKKDIVEDAALKGTAVE
jgi:hypothetical protein